MASVSLEDPILDFSKLKVPDLKKELKSRGLSTSGNKTELIERLQTLLKSTKSGTSDSIIDDIEEDLLNDDDDEHIDDGTINLINELDHDLDDIPKSTKRKLDSENELPVGPPKKIILKRNTNETLAALAKTDVKVTEEKVGPKLVEQLKEDSIGDRKVIKLTELSIRERLEMRAKKFGVTSLTDDAKKMARAERFGSVSTANSSASIKSNPPNTSIDVLKQRAARFGGSVSNIMSDLENQEKKEKRKERFGILAATVKSPADLQVAKAARLERFKTAVK